MKNSLPVLFFSGVCLMAAMTECFSAEKTTKSVQKTTIENKEKSASFRKEINEQLNKWKTDKKDNNFQIQQLKVMLDKPELSESDKFYIRERIAVLCSVPEDSGSSWIWSRVPHETFDRSAAKRELEAAALPALRNPSFTSSDKIILAEKYVWFLGDENRFAEAEEFALNLTKAQDFKNPHDQARAWILLSNVCRWQDKYEDAMNAIRQGMKTDALYAIKAGCKLAAAFNRKDDAAALWTQLNNPYEELVFYFDSQGSDFGLTPLAVRDARLCNMANRFVRDPKNNAEKRMEVAKRYCFDRNNPGSLESLRILNASIGFKSQKAAGPFASNSVQNAVFHSFQLADYMFTAQLCDILKDLPAFAKSPALMSVYVISLGASGREAEAAKLAAEYAKSPDLSDVQQLRMKLFADILSGHEDLIDKDINASGLTADKKAEVILSAGRQCLLWRKNVIAEKLSAKYFSYFSSSPNRGLSVKFFDKPVSGIANWREIYPQLEKQYCDLAFKGSLDFLETDVGTGNRDIKVDKNAKEVKPLEITSCCDRSGLHIFLRAETSEQRNIEHGFARGMSYEMYFAPGKNQPYICIGADAMNGLNFIFNTTYNNINNTRPDQQDHRYSFHSEMDYTDNDYVLHMFFSWDSFYNKLPENNSEWRFEVLAFAPNGGYTWGGSRGIHSASQWGNLKFVLNQEQIAKIRKEILIRACRDYRKVRVEPKVAENIFDMWRDPYVGDPDFYAKCIVPLKDELAAYETEVQQKGQNLTDAEASEIYVKAVPKMKGLKYEIDELRRKYLMEQLILGNAPRQK